MDQAGFTLNGELDRAAQEAERLFARTDWPALAALSGALPTPLTESALGLADRVAFALGQLRNFVDAVDLTSRAFALVPTARRAASLAYLFYASLLEEASPQRGRDRPRARCVERQLSRKAFREWTERALALDARAVKVWYRLGIFESKVEHGRDKRALRAFEQAIELFRALPVEDQARRGDLRKACHRAHYAAARSALALGLGARARAHAFACIRADRDHDDVAPVHKLTMAGKACLAQGELEHAERAFRLALEAKGPPRRDFLYDLLADVARARGEWDVAARWIETHVSPPRRSPAQWRKLGELALAQGEVSRALTCLKNALMRDRSGRHLTLTALGDALRATGDARAAQRAYRDAMAFRQRTYLSEHGPAKAGLADLEAAGSARPPLAKGRPRPERGRAAGGEGR